jgi:hypothetical protein
MMEGGKKKTPDRARQVSLFERGLSAVFMGHVVDLRKESRHRRSPRELDLMLKAKKRALGGRSVKNK